MSYEKYLAASSFTSRWRTALRVGVGANGVAIGVIGLLFLIAAWQADASEAGDLAGAFDWIGEQVYCRGLVAALCLGLPTFPIFSFVEARWRVVSRLAGDKIETLARAAWQMTARVR